MPRHAVERHNEDFKELFERRVTSLDRWGAVEEATQEAAELLGVNAETVHGWRRPIGGKAAIGCPRWRVDMYRVALPLEISGVSDKQREEIMAGLRYLRGSGAMSELTIAAFDRLVRREKRRAA